VGGDPLLGISPKIGHAMGFLYLGSTQASRFRATTVQRPHHY
jgi:hypothetical protein